MNEILKLTIKHNGKILSNSMYKKPRNMEEIKEILNNYIKYKIDSVFNWNYRDKGLIVDEVIINDKENILQLYKEIMFNNMDLIVEKISHLGYISDSKIENLENELRTAKKEKREEILKLEVLENKLKLANCKKKLYKIKIIDFDGNSCIFQAYTFDIDKDNTWITGIDLNFESYEYYLFKEDEENEDYDPRKDIVKIEVDGEKIFCVNE